MTANDDVRVLIVDDSSIVRRVLQAELNKQPGITVVGTAPDPFIARNKVVDLQPDALTLDIEMPRMDGLTFLRKLMKYHPLPTIILSSLTQRGSKTALACLEAGAIDVVPKPNESYSVGDVAKQLGQMLREARRVRVRPATTTPKTATQRPAVAAGAMIDTTEKVIAIGASTGGTEAIREVLEPLPKTVPGIVMVQHMPEGFTTSFAERLNSLCEIEVREATNGDRIMPGVALLAPGNKHMRVARDGARYLVQVTDGPSVCRHRPSVEVLFTSMAQRVGSNGFGIMLTGMGNDGATGMKAMHDAGAPCISQDEASCVVYGMPRSAVEAGAVDRELPLAEIAGAIMQFASQARAAA